MTRVACDWLKDDVLPDLASAIRRIVLQVQTTIRYSPIANATTRITDDPNQPESRLKDPSIQSGTPQSENDANVTLVPEQIQ